MKSMLKKLPQIGLTIYGVFYLLSFGLPALIGNYSTDRFENNSVLAMFVFFTVALIVSWIKEKIGGVLFVLWSIGVFILGTLFWEGAGMAIVLATIVLLVGILIYRNGIKKTS
jgi:prolipoprotein diacylglyceryltransferase